MRQRLKLMIAAFAATTLCIGNVVPVQAQSHEGEIEVRIGFGNGNLDIDTFSAYDNPGQHVHIFVPPENCSHKLKWSKMPDFNLTLIDAAGVERETINAKNFNAVNCRVHAKFSNLPAGTYSLKVQYDNVNYALFYGLKKLEGKSEQIVDKYEAIEDQTLVEKPIQIGESQKLSPSRLAFTLTHRPLALKYKTEIGTFEHDGQAVQEAEIYPRRDGEAAQWFEHGTWIDGGNNGQSFIGIGVPYAAIPAAPISSLRYAEIRDKYKMGRFPGIPQLDADKKEEYAGYKWLGWAAYKWDETEFTEATQLRDENGEPILYTDTKTGGEFPIYEDVLFVAKWEKPTRTISFKTAADEGTINGGTTVEYTIEGNDSLKTLNKEVPKPVALPGYEFVGWFTDLSRNTVAEQDIFEKRNTSDVQYYAKYRQVPAKECKPGMSSKNSWLIALLPIIGGAVATVIPVVNKFLAGIVDSIKPQALKDFEAWLMQRTGSSVSEEAQAAGTAITASAVLGVLSWWLFSKQEDQC